MPTRYWLTPSGVRLPTSENTSEIKSGLKCEQSSAFSVEIDPTKRQDNAPSVINVWIGSRYFFWSDFNRQCFSFCGGGCFCGFGCSRRRDGVGIAYGTGAIRASGAAKREELGVVAGEIILREWEQTMELVAAIAKTQDEGWDSRKIHDRKAYLSASA